MRPTPRLPALAAMALSLAFAGPAAAQPAINATGNRQVVSPEVAVDGRITFRLSAPNAQTVTVTGDFITPNTRLAKDAATGVWSYTTPAMPPGLYGYYFSLDGIRFTDPGNLLTLAGAHFLKSYVEVRGQGGEFWAQRDVPHGQLHELWYHNPALGERHVVIYTPPGYDPAAAKTYPVVYLYSGSGDNEFYWTKIGRAHFILDNLLADGRARPAILVMPYGSTVVPSPPDGQEDTGGAGVYGVTAIGSDLVGSVIPLVEKNFKAGREPRDRAIFGFSMGGYLAPTIGLNHPELFGWVAGASADFRNPGGAPNNFPGLVANLATAKRNLQWFGMMVGTDPASGESGHTNASKSAVDYVTSLGLRAEWAQPPGGSHTWTSWRGYFRDLMANKFFADDPYATPRVGMPLVPPAPAAP